MKRNTRWMGVVGVLALTLGALASPSSADDRDELVEKQKEQESQIESYKSDLEGVDTDLQKVYLQLQQTQTQIPIAQEELATAQSELAAATREQESIAAQLEAAQSELETLNQKVETGHNQVTAARNQLSAMARAQYRGETGPSRWEIISGSKSSDDFANAVSASRAAYRKQAETLAQLEADTAAAENKQSRQKAVKAKIAELKEEADEVVAEKQEKETAAQAKAEQLVSLESSYESQSQELNAKKGEFEASISQVTAARDETAAQIAEIDAENQRKAEAEQAAAAERQKQEQEQQQQADSSSQEAASQEQAAAPKADVGSSFLIPVVPRPLYVTSPFGMREYPFGGRYMHNGVDLRSACGQEQIAPGNGVVAKVIPAPGNSTHGNQIYINLGMVNGHSWVVVTNHLSGFNVQVGQQVSQGDVIGWTGQTGKVTGCHVHMEVWRDGQVIDPMSLPPFN